MKHKVYGKTILKGNKMSVHHKKHHVKIHKWIHGILEVVHHNFESLEEALGFADEHSANKEHSGHQVKVYNEDNELVHTTNCYHDTYA